MLGVLARGTDYFSLKPHAHAIQPTVEQLKSKISEVMEMQLCEKIYLATEELEIYQELMREYGDLIIAPEMPRYTVEDAGENINDCRQSRTHNAYLKGLEYLETVWMLSNCQCLVAGNVGGAQGAVLLSKGFDYLYIFDLGTYR